MDDMFRDATSFNQDISGWDVVNNVRYCRRFNDNSGLESHKKPTWGAYGSRCNNSL